MTKAFVMAAGVGTRLEPLTLSVPKPLVPVCNVPIMEYNISLLRQHGFKDITANLHYFPDQIESYFGDGAAFGVSMRYSFEEELMGTAGGVRKMAGVADLKEGGRALVMSADVLTDIDISALVKFHEERGSRATIALIGVEDTSEFGVVVTEPSGRITAFQEKPRNEEALSRMVNTGIYVLEKEVIDLIPPETFYDFGKQLFPLLIEKGVPFFGFEAGCYWKDIGSIGNYKAANFDIAYEKLKTVFDHGKVHSPGKVIGKNTRMDQSVNMAGPVIVGTNCVIEKGACLNGAVIWNNVRVGGDSKITNSIVGDHSLIEGSCRINESVIASRKKIAKGSIITSQAF